MLNALIRLISLLSVIALSACVDDEGTVTRGDDFAASRQSLIYTYPAREQAEVPISAPLVLRFSSAVVDSAPAQLVSVRDSSGALIDFAGTLSNDGQSLVLTPANPLAPLTPHQVSVGAIALSDGRSMPASFSFITGASRSGPRSEIAEAGDFRLRRMIPDGDNLPVLDFTSLRLQLSQPIAESTIRYGDTLQLVGPDGLVAARVLVGGRDITVDPLADLTAGVSYQLTLDSGIESVLGESFTPLSISLTPKSSGNRALLTQQVVDSDQGAVLSALTGEPVNTIPLRAILLGTDNLSQQAGVMQVELAELPMFPDTAPLRILAGTRINGSSLPVRIAGSVPAGFASGDVTIEFISDAVGYMQPNDLSPLQDVPRLIRLFMDVAISTADQRANGAITQNLLHLELVGNARVDGGRLVVDAVGMTEPVILGAEAARSLLSFNLVGFDDQRNPPPPVIDLTAPQANGWVADLPARMVRAGDALVLNNSEALSPETLLAGDSIRLNDSLGAAVPFSLRQDGSALVVTPDQPLMAGATYWVSLLDGALDQAGNAATPRTASFDVAGFDSDSLHAPVLLSAYPGFPCATVDWDLAENDAGRCNGGASSDDHLPVSPMPADRPIRVTFSQPISIDSVNQQTFIVERIDSNNMPIGVPVSGRLEAQARALRFHPDQPWQENALYRYTLLSVPGNPLCGTDAICSAQGLPLQTRLLAQNPETASQPGEGGTPLQIFFRGAPRSNAVLQLLHNLPSTDSNANFIHDPSEPDAQIDDSARLNSARLTRNPSANPVADGSAALAVPADARRTVVDVNIGCGFSANEQPLNCPDAGLLFLNGDLFADIIGTLSAAEVNQRYPDDAAIPDIVRSQGGVLVYIYPTQVYLSGTTVHTRQTNFISSIGITVPPTDTGLQIMRLRYRCDARSGNCTAPDYGRIKGWIVEQDGEARLLTTLDLYLDAPRLNPLVEQNGAPQPLITISHDLRSKPLSLALSGALTFLPDGRLQISQISTSALNIDVELDVSIVAENDVLFLQVPDLETNLNYVSEAIKP